MEYSQHILSPAYRTDEQNKIDSLIDRYEPKDKE